MLTQKRLKELLHYDSDTGMFTWRADRGSAKAGDVAGSVDSHGYIRINIDGRRYLAHRIAWLYTHGSFPPNDLDHVNHSVADNSIKNLRLATRSENQQNSGISSNNTSGFKGVHWDESNGKWRARARIGYKNHHLGYFPTAEQASGAYQAFARQNHGAFYLPPEVTR